MKLSLRSAVAAFAIAFAWGCGPASAVSILPFPGGGVNPLDFIATPGNVYSAQQSFGGSASVDDVYAFVLNSPPLPTTTTAVALDFVGSLTNFGIKNLVASWFADSSTGGSPTGSALASVQVTDSLGDVIGNPIINLALSTGGFYDLVLQGQALRLGGSYQASIKSETPIPAALPLFATGMGIMSLLGWRKKKKRKAGRLAAPLAA